MDVLARMREDRKKTVGELEDLSRKKAEIEAQERDARVRLTELDNALRVAERYIMGTSAGPSEADLPERELGPDSGRISIEDALWSVFQETTKGVKLSDVIEAVEERYGINVNPKTAGNYFWNWKNLNRARREGYIWYPVRTQ